MADFEAYFENAEKAVGTDFLDLYEESARLGRMVRDQEKTILRIGLELGEDMAEDQPARSEAVASAFNPAGENAEYRLYCAKIRGGSKLRKALYWLAVDPGFFKERIKDTFGKRKA